MTERPRDRLGRPLPPDSPNAAPTVPGIDGLDDAQVWALSIGLLDDGLPFNAHEVLESRWRTAQPNERDAWRACAQWTAALTHDGRGNPTGARSLAARTLETLDAAAHVPPAIDQETVRASCRQLIDRNAG